MFEYEYTICQRLKQIISDAENYISLLYDETSILSKKLLIHQFKDKMIQINNLSSMLCEQDMIKQLLPLKLQTQNNISYRDLTLQELAKFNGRDGNPAYVAVNGVVYDVTNNAAWAAASHFGLEAGKDLTAEFTSCHAGQQILNKLKVVGNLIS